MVDGTLAEERGDGVLLQCDEKAKRLKEGAKVVLTIEGQSDKRTGVINLIAEEDNGRFTVGFTDHQKHASDKRDFPRLHAGIPLEYRIADSDQAAAWIAGENVAGDWVKPDPYMNFSVGGVRFDCPHLMQGGETLLIKLQIGDDSRSWRATGTVVRVFDVPDGSSASCSAAVSFETLPVDARDALSELTLKIQDSLL
jgi:hypothetical protein